MCSVPCTVWYKLKHGTNTWDTYYVYSTACNRAVGCRLLHIVHTDWAFCGGVAVDHSCPVPGELAAVGGWSAWDMFAILFCAQQAIVPSRGRQRVRKSSVSGLGGHEQPDAKQEKQRKGPRRGRVPHVRAHRSHAATHSLCVRSPCSFFSWSCSGQMQ